MEHGFWAREAEGAIIIIKNVPRVKMKFGWESIMASQPKEGNDSR